MSTLPKEELRVETRFDYLVEWIDGRKHRYCSGSPFRTEKDAKLFIKGCKRWDKGKGNDCVYEILKRTITTKIERVE